jgi:uncharacterized protein YbbC (DUF1343 family)
MRARVKTGLDVLVEEGFSRLRGAKVGLLAHPASVDVELRHVLGLMHGADIDLRVLLGPEHGITGEAQDMESVFEHAIDPLTGARVFSLYGASSQSLHPTRAMLEDLDVLVVDLQDVGARYYTFAATMIYAIEVAASARVRVLVLDRPNPLGGRDEDIEGPAIDPKYRSFVGAFDVPIRHGLTLGEFARYVTTREKIDVDLEIVKMEGWSRAMDFEATGLSWVQPSPNMPTVETARVYPGQCLFEGTNLSEGRGTTRPFELVGAPFIDGAAWAERAQRTCGPGVVFRPTFIRPTFHKHAHERCGAVQMHITDRGRARPVRAAIALIEAARHLAPDRFAWRTERYEFVSDRLAIDLLFGSDAPRRLLEGGATVPEVVETFADDERAFREARRPSLLYATQRL